MVWLNVHNDFVLYRNYIYMVYTYLIVLLFIYYSPGLSADANVDELIKKSCGDADVFVYVCNGTSTLEEPVIMQIAMLYKYTAPWSRVLILV